MKVGDASANRKPADFGVVPRNWESNWSIKQDAEVVGVVSVIPQVVGINNKILAESLLQAAVKFVSLAWRHGRRGSENAGWKAARSPRACAHRLLIMEGS